VHLTALAPARTCASRHVYAQRRVPQVSGRTFGKKDEMTSTRIQVWIAILAFATTLGCTSRKSAYRADEFLIANFEAHKSEFEALLEMFRRDTGLIYFAHARTIPEYPDSVGIGPERLEQYRHLFSVLGLDGMAAAD
jgi:hypothetical protein